MTDPITDMLNQIRSAEAVKKPEVVIPFSNLKHEMAKIFAKEGFITEAKKVAKGKFKALKIVLKYENGEPLILGSKRVSKPGQRIYEKSSEIRKVKGGSGISVVSTSKGLMTGKQAKVKKLGGEVICEIW